MDNLKQLLIKTVNYCWVLVATFIILFAIFLVILRQFILPNIDSYRYEIQGLLSESIGRAVVFGEIEARWQGIGPEFIIHDTQLTVADTGEQIKIANLHVVIHLWKTLYEKQLTTKEISIKGLNFDVEEYRPFEYRVSGIDGSEQSTAIDINPVIDLIFNQRLVSFSNVDIELKKYNQKQMQISLTELAVQNESNQHHLIGEAIIDNAANYRLQASFEGDPRLQNGRGDIYIEASEIPLDTLPLNLESLDLAFKGRVSLKSWFAWKNASIQKGLLSFDAQDITWSLSQKQSEKSSSISIEVDVIRKAKQEWFFQLSKFEVDEGLKAIDKAYAKLSLQPLNKYWLGNIGQIDLSVIELLSELPMALMGLQVSTEDQLSGVVSDSKWYLPIEIEDNGFLYVMGANSHEKFVPTEKQSILFSGYLNRLSLFNKQSGLKLDNLNLVANGVDDSGQINFKNSNFSFHWQEGFTEGLNFQRFNGSTNWRYYDNALSVDIEAFQLRSDSVNLDLSANTIFRAGEPAEILVQATNGEVQVTDIQKWLPTKVMGKDSQEFLASAFSSGKVSNLQFHWISEWEDFNSNAFDNLLGVADLTELSISFDSNWPSAGMKQGQILLEGDNVNIDTSTAFMANLNGLSAQASLYQFADEKIGVFVDSEQPINSFDALEWLKQTPLQKNLEQTLRNIELTNGLLDTSLELDIPLSNLDLFDFKLFIDFEKFDLWLFDREIPVNQLTGTFSVDSSSLKLSEAKAKLFSDKYSNISLVGDYDDLGNVKLNISSSGFSDLSAVTEKFWRNLPGLERGDVPVVVNGEVLSDESNTRYKFRILPDIQNIHLDLPEPLNKNAGDKAPLRVFITGYNDSLNLDITYQDLLSTKQRIDLSGGLKWLGGDLILNRQDKIDFNEVNTLLLDIQLDKVQINDWVEWLSDFKTSGEGRFEIFSLQGGVQIEQMYWEQVPLGKVSINFQPDEEQMVMSLVGDNIDGQIHIDHNKQVRVVLQKAILPDLPKSWFDSGEENNKSLSDASETENKQIFLTRDLPQVQLICHSCWLRELEFKAFKLETQKVNDGLTYILSADADNRTGIQGAGFWRQTEQEQGFSLTGDVSTNSINFILSKLNQDLGIRKSGANIGFDFYYAGDLTQFDVENLVGHVSGSIDGGQLLEVDDKGARLLSILSIQNIVRRLFLDFSNLFEKGFFYNKIQLDILLSNAKVYSNRLSIDGDAANIEINGYTDLETKTLSQRALIYPELTESLPVLAGWALEPMTGLAVLILSEIFNPAIEVMTQSEMEISGTWSDPVTKEIKRTKEKVKISEKIIQQGKALQSENNEEEKKDKQNIPSTESGGKSL